MAGAGIDVDPGMPELPDVVELPDAVATSALQRARRTGELVATELGIDLLAAEAGLDERSAGIWEGMTRVEIERDFPGFLDDGRRPEGYESEEAVLARALPALASVHEAAVAAGHQRVLVVSHGGVLGALERHARMSSGGTPPPWVRFDNLEGCWFTLDADGVCVAGDRVRLADVDVEPAGDATAPYL